MGIYIYREINVCLGTHAKFWDRIERFVKHLMRCFKNYKTSPQPFLI